jgi:hypothetical protein
MLLPPLQLTLAYVLVLATLWLLVLRCCHKNSTGGFCRSPTACIHPWEHSVLLGVNSGLETDTKVRRAGC